MKRQAGVACCALLLAFAADAQQMFVDNFESGIAPQFPLVGGVFQLPPGPARTELNWVLAELAAGETTTIDEINAHFDAAWLAQTNATQTQTFINAVRTSYPNARVTDVITVTPHRLVLLIDSPGSPPPSGYMVFGTRYAAGQKIVQFGVSGYGGSVQFPADQSLTLTQAADKFTTLSALPSLMVGRIGANGNCSVTVDRGANTVRATGSVFKLWVLGGAARAVVDGTLSEFDNLPLVASELAPAGTINSEPLGTLFPVKDLATLMLGISDNTATDLLHERVGRTLMNQMPAAFGMAQPTLLTPFLGINEQFHLFYSFPLVDSQSYIAGDDAFQSNFLNTRIVPLGPVTTTPFFHASLLVDGSWRASPLDVCAAFSALRRLPRGSEAMRMADRALSASAAQPDVRGDWDRVWYKGGSLSSGAGFHVLVHAWLLEDAGQDPYVVVAMSNSNTGGIDQFNVQSVTGRILELLSQL